MSIFRVSTNETTMSIEFGSPDRCIYKRFVPVFLTANMIGFNFSENDVKEFGENTDPIKVTKDGKTYCKVLQGNGYRNMNDTFIPVMISKSSKSTGTDS